MRSEYIQSTSSRETILPAIVQETILVHESHINQESQFPAAVQLHSAVAAGEAEESQLLKLKPDVSAQVQPFQLSAQSEKDSNMDGKTHGSNKPVKTSKRPFQHASSEKPTKSSKSVETTPPPEEAQIAISAPTTHVQQGKDSTARHVINRPDGEETTRLRNCPDGSSRNGVWVKGNASVGQGEVVEVLRKDFAGEEGFAYIRTGNNIEGFVRSEYIQSTILEGSQKPTSSHPVLASHKAFITNSCIPHVIREEVDSIDCSSTQVTPTNESLC